MSITDKTIVSTDVSAAGHVIFNTKLNADAGFVLSPKIVLLTGTIASGGASDTVTYDLSGYNAYIEVNAAETGTTRSYYAAYTFIYSSNGTTSNIVEQVVGAGNATSPITMSYTITGGIISFSGTNPSQVDTSTFLIKITAWDRLLG